MDYEPIFNKLTRDALLKFIETRSVTVAKGRTKDDLQKHLLDEFAKNKPIEESFQDFYRRTEEAGRKHFFLYILPFQENEEKHLCRKAQNSFLVESEREFDPERDNGKWFYSLNDNKLTIKAIDIRKTYVFENEEEHSGTLTREYLVKKIHFVKFWEFDFKRNRIIFGHDTYGDILKKRSLQKELFEFLERFMEGRFASAESLIRSEHIEALRFLPNCLVHSIQNQAAVSDSALYKKKRADIDRILSDLKHNKYPLSDIKEKNPDHDIQTNLLFEAGMEKAIDVDLDLRNDRADFYFFTERGGYLSYFRFAIEAVNSQLITYSGSVTRRELWDVFDRIGKNI